VGVEWRGGVTTRRTFGILSPFVGGDYYGAIIAGANEAAVAGGDRLVAVQTLDPGAHSADRSGIPDFRRPLAWQHLAGLIVLPGAVDTDYAREATRAGLPVVFVGQDATSIGASAVLADNRGGVRDAVAHLVAHGHVRIAFGGHFGHFDVRERREGYREGLRAHGLVPSDDLQLDAGDNHESGGEAVADALIRAGMPATAVVLGTDRNAIGLIQRIQVAGHDVPDELAVVGFDDIADGAYLQPSLSTILQPPDVLGATGYAVVRDLATDPSVPPQTRVVATSQVRRRSCGCPEVALPGTHTENRTLFGQVQYLQGTLTIQYELSIELLGTHEFEPRDLGWLGQTPAVRGCLGLWPHPEQGLGDDLLEIVGEFPDSGGATGDLGSLVPVSAFPPAAMLEHISGAAGNVMFLVPIRSSTRDWGVLAVVTSINTTAPPGSELMNQSGALLAAALDYTAILEALRDKEEVLRSAALHDHLTGLPNRSLLGDRLERAALDAARRPGHRFAILLLDLDGFKAVNDTLGHAAGDTLLVEVARRLTGLLRASDTVARIGGDEFVVLLDGLVEHGWQDVVCDSIRAAISEPFVLDGHEVEVGLSIGVAVSTPGSVDTDHLLREADAAMYRAKSMAKLR
jgi:diguanylate cyclase (GGDEF)-like protein